MTLYSSYTLKNVDEETFKSVNRNFVKCAELGDLEEKNCTVLISAVVNGL